MPDDEVRAARSLRGSVSSSRRRASTTCVANLEGSGAVSLEELDAFLSAADRYLAGLGCSRRAARRPIGCGPGRRSRAGGRALPTAGDVRDATSRASRGVRDGMRDVSQRIRPSTDVSPPATRGSRKRPPRRSPTSGWAERSRPSNRPVVASSCGAAGRRFEPPPRSWRCRHRSSLGSGSTRRSTPRSGSRSKSCRWAWPRSSRFRSVGEPAPCAVQCADAPFWFWVGNGGDGWPRPVVTSFAGSELRAGGARDGEPRRHQVASPDRRARPRAPSSVGPRG